jgi:hypothetical protein
MSAVSVTPFVDILRRKMTRGTSLGVPRHVVWDNKDRALILTYEGGGGRGPRRVTVVLSESSVAEFTDGRLDKDVRDVWGPGVESVEGAARFAVTYIDEQAQSAHVESFLLELTSTGFRGVSGS